MRSFWFRSSTCALFSSAALLLSAACNAALSIGHVFCIVRILRFVTVVVLLADFVDLWMSLAEFLGICIVLALWHYPLWVLLLTASCAACLLLVLVLLPPTYASPSSCTQTLRSSLSGMSAPGPHPEDDVCGSGFIALKESVVFGLRGARYAC